MSATYNWTYTAGSTIPVDLQLKLGPLAIADSADDVRPSNAVYIALSGNDLTGNGSRIYPLRTITEACRRFQAYNFLFIIGAGVYREGEINGGLNLLGDGDVVIDGTNLFGSFLLSTDIGSASYNVRFKGFTYFNGNNYSSGHFNSQFDGVGPGGPGFNYNSNYFRKNVMLNTSFYFDGPGAQYAIITNLIANSTFISSNVVFTGNTDNQKLGVNSCIFYNCNIYVASIPNYIDYCLFYQCNFRFDTSISTPFPATFYPNVPPGYTAYSNIADLQAACETAYGSGSVFANCRMEDPLFNNPAINDYSLSLGSPAKNAGYLGTFIGARSIAYAIKAASTASDGNFDLSSGVNVNVIDNYISLANATRNGSIKTNVIVNPGGGQVRKLLIYGFNADRQGQYVDSIADLDTTYKYAGDVLNAPAPYLVETGALVYNNAVFQPGDRLLTVTGLTTFSSVTGGTLREIVEAPQRHTIMARFSSGGPAVAAGTALVSGYWYYVNAGSISYNGITYNVGTCFKAVNTVTFSGSGSLIIAMGNEAFQHYEPGIQPTSNNMDDSRSGAIIRGNGDPAYVRGGYGTTEFPINAMFIQLYYIINVNNLKP